MKQNASKLFGLNKIYFDVTFRRNCDTETGSLDCWKETTDGFSYGLSTAMIDFCQVILKIRDLNNGQVKILHLKIINIFFLLSYKRILGIILVEIYLVNKFKSMNLKMKFDN